MITVYISIGNSDDKLTQAEWAQFYRDVNLTLHGAAAQVYGQWVSEPASAWQNACWCVEITLDQVVTHDGDTMRRDRWARHRLGELAAQYRQDSIAWAEVPATEFIGPAGAGRGEQG